jgi:hypothetical protein
MLSWESFPQHGAVYQTIDQISQVRLALHWKKKKENDE